ncbi:hypothetical protein SH580_03855 [Coraliomargarita algicola]|uniref:Peptidase S1 domain-containing protein n=1 Tax=Coraliomargarita algicola TaxID=3092156 RepID=A0ABZ0RKU4_9BACT|nr:hypothetical protein [Coraliomargarita sp. J2-16]WPJ96839.1 hypothetical protein SH580_03855 [Coraliomargarita sp. J2-16]
MPFKLIQALGLCLPASIFAAINIIDYTPLTNDRFMDDASFFAAGLDLSGVAIANTSQGPAFTGDDGGRWVTMISPNVFITAHHFAPNVGQSVTFYQTNSALGGSFTASIETTMQIGDTDIRVGTLDTSLPDDYAYYNISTATISSEVPTAITGPNALTFGRSEGDYATSLDMAVGHNNINIFYPEQTFAGSTGDAIVMTFDDPGIVYESQFSLGDSGAPAMILEGGELTIVGINWFVGTLSDGETEISGLSFLPNYQSEIQAFIDENEEVAPVPEASAGALLLGVGALTLALGMRRSL